MGKNIKHKRKKGKICTVKGSQRTGKHNNTVKERDSKTKLK